MRQVLRVAWASLIGVVLAGARLGGLVVMAELLRR
jgi:hypothetical protein